MFFRVNNNISAINTHRLMSENHSKIVNTLEKLSTGQKINRASDGPAKLVISEHLKSQIKGMNQAIDNSETAVSMIQTAEANLAGVNSLLGNIRQLILHSLNEGANDETNLASNQQEIENILDNIDQIADNTRFGNRKLLDGTNGIFGTATGDHLRFISAGIEVQDSRKSGFDVHITEAATKASIIGTTAFTQEIVDSGETLIVMEGGKQAKYTAKADDTVETMLQNFRNEIDRMGIMVDVSLDEQNRLNIFHKLYGSEPRFMVASDTSGILGKNGGRLESAQQGIDVSGTIKGEVTIGKGQFLTGMKGVKCVDGLTIRYTGGESDLEELCRVADFYVEDERFHQSKDEPVEIPEGGVSVGRVFVTQESMLFQIDGSKKMFAGVSLNGVQPSKLGVGIANISGYESLEDIDVRTYQGAQDALTLIDASMEKLLEERGKLGAFQKNSLESNISNLKIANENLVSTESVIRDTDMAKEMANFTKNQIKDDTSAAMFAQANQSSQQVLQLLS